MNFSINKSQHQLFLTSLLSGQLIFWNPTQKYFFLDSCLFFILNYAFLKLVIPTIFFFFFTFTYMHYQAQLPDEIWVSWWVMKARQEVFVILLFVTSLTVLVEQTEFDTPRVSVDIKKSDLRRTTLYLSCQYLSGLLKTHMASFTANTTHWRTTDEDLTFQVFGISLVGVLALHIGTRLLHGW